MGLIVRDVGADDDLSEWDPAERNWYRLGGSVIFGVMPGAEAHVECEVFGERPAAALPVVLFRQEVPTPSRRLVVHDPDEAVRAEFRVGAEDVEFSTPVDSPAT